jgi:tRNA-splicing ligase RtcB
MYHMHEGKVNQAKKQSYVQSLPMEQGMKLTPRIFHHPRLPLEPDAVRQLQDAARLPGVLDVLGMPDLHVGYGVPIGCVIAALDIVCPAAVGYDVNCGMRLLLTPLMATEVEIKPLAEEIAHRIPLGEGKDNYALDAKSFKRLVGMGVPGLKHVEIPQLARDLKRNWNLTGEAGHIEDRGALPADPDACSESAIKRGRTQLATLGGGNHFIELQVVDRVEDEAVAEEFGLFAGQFAIMLHSGSRGLGHQVGDDYMALGRDLAQRDGRETVNRELPYFWLREKHAEDYLGAMNAAANFAFLNRHLMALLVKDAFYEMYPGVPLVLLWDLAHNIAKFEQHLGQRVLVHRKGAARAFGPERMKGTDFAAIGQPVLVPGSMGTASYVMVGAEASADTYASINHGAGRVMSRKAASGRTRSGKDLRGRAAGISDEEFRRAMQGIHLISENLRTAKEEAPQAYKDIGLITEAVVGSGLARTVARLKPLGVLKG